MSKAKTAAAQPGKSSKQSSRKITLLEVQTFAGQKMALQRQGSAYLVGKIKMTALEAFNWYAQNLETFVDENCTPDIWAGFLKVIARAKGGAR